jgi:hypothetical protein
MTMTLTVPGETEPVPTSREVVTCPRLDNGGLICGVTGTTTCTTDPVAQSDCDSC